MGSAAEKTSPVPAAQVRRPPNAATRPRHLAKAVADAIMWCGEVCSAVRYSVKTVLTIAVDGVIAFDGTGKGNLLQGGSIK